MTEKQAMTVCKFFFPGGDNHFVKRSKRGNWELSYTNDYPLQHGEGKKIHLPESGVVKIYRLIGGGKQ